MVVGESTTLPETDHWRVLYDELAKLAGGLAHEIRNPLSTIGLNLELLEEELADSDSPRDHRLRRRLAAVHREFGNLEQIVEEFLQFARAEALERETVDLNDPVMEFVEIFRPTAVEQQVELVPHLAAQLSPVPLDRRLFRQVLHNLCRNALQAMPQGGRLELLTYERPGRVVLEIIDNGHGMDERTQERMFDAFFSTKHGGSGLGLPTVRKIVLAHGGTIECDSALGRGTRFRASFPSM